MAGCHFRQRPQRFIADSFSGLAPLRRPKRRVGKRQIFLGYRNEIIEEPFSASLSTAFFIESSVTPFERPLMDRALRT
jgi:hypothetical protein